MAVSARSASERIILWDKDSHFPINVSNAYCIDVPHLFCYFVFNHTVITKILQCISEAKNVSRKKEPLKLMVFLQFISSKWARGVCVCTETIAENCSQ